MNYGIGVAKIFDWEPQSANQMQYDVIRNFLKKEFLWDRNILEWKIRSLGPGLVRKQDVCKRVGLELKVNVFKI